MHGEESSAASAPRWISSACSGVVATTMASRAVVNYVVPSR